MGTTTSKHKTKAYKLHHSHPPGRPLPPGKPTLKYDPENLDPDTVTIKWDPPAFNGGSKITGYLVEHKRTGSPHWVKASPIKVCHTQLTVCGLEPGWRYQFRVTAENEFGLSDPSPLSEPLAIFVHRSAAIAPYFVTELNDLVVLENEKVEFTVTFEGIPLPKISWYKDGMEMFSNRCQKINTEGCASSLLIYEATISDEAEIKCSATNRVGYAVTRAYLKVEAPPTIRLPRQYEDGLIFEKGETVRLKVSVVGQPVPSIMWFLNGIEIVPSLKYEMDYIDHTASLKVKNAQRNDRGEYQIQASNVLGEDLASILVTIANRPEPPLNVQVVRILGRSVTLAWSPPNDDGGCEIGCYIIEYYKTNWDVWLKVTTSRQLQVILDDLIEGSKYKFRIKAENPYGISDPSTETETIFIPDPKRGIFEPYQADYDNDALIPESVLELEVPQVNQYQNRSTPTRDRLGIDSISNASRYSGDSQTETDGSSENLDRKKFSPVKPARKYRKKAKIEQPSINIDLLNLPEDDYHVHHQMRNSDWLSVDRRLSPSPQPSISVDDTSRTSSELMLVLVPSEEDLRNSRARSLTHDYESTKQIHRTYQIPPPPISLSAPELGSEMEFFKPLQRNCVSSTEILHESTIARFYKELKEEDAAAKFNEKFHLSETHPLDDNFSETSQLLVNRLQKNQVKMSAKDLKSDVVTDLRKIDDIVDDPLIIEDHEKEFEIFPPKPDYDSTPPDRFEKTNSLSRSRVQRQLAPNFERRSLSPSRLTNALPIPSTSSILSVEPHPQGRYSPQSGTFHYPDLFMESLTKSPKFKSTSGSLSELVAELIAKKAASINSYPANQQPSGGPFKPSEEVPSCSKDIGISNSSPISGDRRKTEIADWEENEDSDNVESEDTEESEEDSERFDEEDTYHHSDCAPLSFEEALAISNPKRSVSPTNDLFLESETPFYEDDGEPDYGLHYFNHSYSGNYTNQPISRPASFSIRGEEKLLKPILKVSSYEEPNATNSHGQGDPPDYVRAAIQRRDSRSPKKHVRIEEPNKEYVPQRKPEDTSLVIINHYSDIVKQYGNVQKPPVRKYMTYEELKAAAQLAERDMESFEGDGELDDEDLDDVFLDNQPNKYETELETIHSDPGPIVKTEVETEKVKKRVHFFFDFCLDFFMFTFACWVYCFKDERLAIPIIILMVYRQLYDKIKNKLPKFDFWRKPKVS